MTDYQAKGQQMSQSLVGRDGEKVSGLTLHDVVPVGDETQADDSSSHT